MLESRAIADAAEQDYLAYKQAHALVAHTVLGLEHQAQVANAYCKKCEYGSRNCPHC